MRSVLAATHNLTGLLSADSLDEDDDLQGTVNSSAALPKADAKREVPKHPEFRVGEVINSRYEVLLVLGRLDDFVTRSGFVMSPVVVWAGPAETLTPNLAEVASVHRIPVDEFLRADAPMLEVLPEHAHPVLRMPVGESWIAAPTAAILYQFRELCLLGRPTRVAHFEQPLFAWR